MTQWISRFVLAVTLAVGTLSASSVGGPTLSGPDAKQLAQKGHSTFVEVLGGDEAKYPEAVKYMEQSRDLEPNDPSNLYNLARAYFYDAVSHNNPDAAAKAEQTLAKLLEVKPTDTRALSFHGSVLTLISRGQDIGNFMMGAHEMMTAVEKDPANINNRIVIAFTSQNFPPQALAAMGNYDSLKDLEFVRDAFDGKKFYYAPHADVVMKAIVGEAYKKRGDEAKARANFEAALAVPKPEKENERAGRDVLDKAIRSRMSGGTEPLAASVFGGCHSCHLNAPDKLLR